MKKNAKKVAKKATVKPPGAESPVPEDKQSVVRPPVVESAAEEERKAQTETSIVKSIPTPKEKEFKMDFDSVGKYSDYMYNFVAKILGEVGPRAPCSPEEAKAAMLIHDELKQSCDEVHIEDFYCYPRAFLGWIRITVVSLMIGFFLFFLIGNGPIERYTFTLIPLAFSVFGLLCLYKQFLSYEEWTPKFLPYKRGHSQNVVGTFKPQGEIKRRVIFSGHIDSAFRFNLIQWTKAGYAFFLIAGIGVLIVFVLLYVVQLIVNFTGTTGLEVSIFLNWVIAILPIFLGFFVIAAGKNKKIFYGAFRHLNQTAKGLIIGNSAWIILMAFLFVYIFFPALDTYFITNPMVGTSIFTVVVNLLPVIALIFFVDKKATPGAIDNLTGVAIPMCIAQIIHEWRKSYPEKVPKNTEVQIVLVGCEEAGLRGSEAYGRRHADEFNTIDTTCVNLESISDVKIVTIFTEEKTTGTKLTPEVYKLLDQCATELDIRHNLDHMPGVAGGTDAAGFVRGGLRASSLCGLKYKDYLAYYHTDRDNLDVYNKERRPWADHGHTWQERNIRGALEKALCICIRYLEKKDADTTAYVSPKLDKIIRHLSPQEKAKLSELLAKELNAK